MLSAAVALLVFNLCSVIWLPLNTR